MGFTINRQKRLFFYLQLSKCILRLTVKKFQCISNFAISSADLHGILAPEESINWKPGSHALKITIPKTAYV